MRFVEDGEVSMVTVVAHVDEALSIGRKKSRCDKLGRDLNQYVTIVNLGKVSLLRRLPVF